MPNLCQLRVTSDGRYCCGKMQLHLSDCHVGRVNYANMPETLIEMQVSNGQWVPASPPTLTGSGSLSLYTPGLYRFDVDCEALEGTEAPADAPMALCFDDEKVDDWGQVLSGQMQELCEKILAADDNAALAEIIGELKAICDKMLAEREVAAEQLQCLEDIKELVTCPPAAARGVITTW